MLLFVSAVLEDPFMCRLARDLGNVHFQLGSLLRIDRAVIEQIESDYRCAPEKRLNCWCDGEMRT